jgi:hypothetical protein
MTMRRVRVRYVDSHRDTWTELAMKAFGIIEKATNDRRWVDRLYRSYRHMDDNIRSEDVRDAEEVHFDNCLPKLEKLTGTDWYYDMDKLRALYNDTREFDDAFESKFRELLSEHISFAFNKSA